MRSKPTLAFCLIMDLIGSASYFLPGMGEWLDIAWAPISAYIFYRSFGGKTGTIGSIINFAEELLPFADFVPTFTIAHIYKRFLKKNVE